MAAQAGMDLATVADFYNTFDANDTSVKVVIILVLQKNQA